MEESKALILPLPARRRLPDAGVQEFVYDMLEGMFGIVVESLPDHWVPLGVMSTLTWLHQCGWWPFENVGVYRTEEQYENVYQHTHEGGIYEMDSDLLEIFREDPAKNLYEERLRDPGVRDLERIEAVAFVIDLFQDEWHREPPPRMLVEMIVFATLMWVASPYGRDYLAEDPLFYSVYQHGVAYLHKAQNDILDPTQVSSTFRKPGSCRRCGHELWCVQGYFYDGSVWAHLCNFCIIQLRDEGAEVEQQDVRIQMPSCPQFGGSCTKTSCPHSAWNEQKFKEELRQVGSERVQAYKDQLRLGGKSPLALAGHTEEKILDHFADIVCVCGYRVMSARKFLKDTEALRSRHKGKAIQFDCPSCRRVLTVKT